VLLGALLGTELVWAATELETADEEEDESLEVVEALLAAEAPETRTAAT